MIIKPFNCRFHLHNIELQAKASRDDGRVGSPGDDGDDGDNHDTGGPQYVGQFGFHTTTCVGYIPQDNTWQDDWAVSISGSHCLIQYMKLITEVDVYMWTLKG